MNFIWKFLLNITNEYPQCSVKHTYGDITTYYVDGDEPNANEAGLGPSDDPFEYTYQFEVETAADDPGECFISIGETKFISTEQDIATSGPCDFEVMDFCFHTIGDSHNITVGYDEYPDFEGEPSSQTITVNAEYPQLFSFLIQPTDDVDGLDMQILFQNADYDVGSIDDLVITDSFGNFTAPSFGVNQIGNVETSQGYQISNPDQDTTVTIYGAPYDYTSDSISIIQPNGVNLIPYNRTDGELQLQQALGFLDDLDSEPVFDVLSEPMEIECNGPADPHPDCVDENPIVVTEMPLQPTNLLTPGKSYKVNLTNAPTGPEGQPIMFHYTAIDQGNDEYFIIDQWYGCTDPDANNYDSRATDDDGSCEFDPTVEVDVINVNQGGSVSFPLVGFDENPGAADDYTFTITTPPNDGRIIIIGDESTNTIVGSSITGDEIESPNVMYQHFGIEDTGEGVDSFQYSFEDPDGNQVTNTITINVNDVSNTPLITIGEIPTATEDQDFTITFNVEDVDSDGTIQVTANNSSNIDVDNGGNSTSTYTQGTTSHSVVITPEDDFDGTVNVVITAISTGESNDRTCTKLQFLYKDISIPVYSDIFYDWSDYNNSPVVTSASARWPEGWVGNDNLTNEAQCSHDWTTDVSGDGSNISANFCSAIRAVCSDGTSVLITTETSLDGSTINPNDVVYSTGDQACSKIATQTISINLTDVLDDPTFNVVFSTDADGNNVVDGVQQGGSIFVTITADDPDSGNEGNNFIGSDFQETIDSLEFGSIQTDPAPVFANNYLQFYYTHGGTQPTEDEILNINWVGNSTLGDFDITIPIIDVNEAPQITSIAPTQAIEDEEYQYQVVVFDPEGDDIVYSLSNQPDGMEISDTGLITWTPLNGVVTSGEVTVTVSDDELEDSQTFTIEVQAVNDAPVIDAISPQEATEDVEFTYQVTATDQDSDTIEFYAINTPSGFEIDTDGNVSWTPTNAQAGQQYTIQIYAYDDLESISSPVDLVINVIAVDEGPKVIYSIPDDSFTEDTSLEINLSNYFFDEEGDTISYTAALTDENGNLENKGIISTDINVNLLTISGIANKFGSQYLQITATSSGNSLDSNVFKITVINDDADAPRVRINNGDYSDDYDLIHQVNESAGYQEFVVKIFDPDFQNYIGQYGDWSGFNDGGNYYETTEGGIYQHDFDTASYNESTGETSIYIRYNPREIEGGVLDNIGFTITDPVTASEYNVNIQIGINEFEDDPPQINILPYTSQYTETEFESNGSEFILPNITITDVDSNGTVGAAITFEEGNFTGSAATITRDGDGDGIADDILPNDSYSLGENNGYILTIQGVPNQTGMITATITATDGDDNTITTTEDVSITITSDTEDCLDPLGLNYNQYASTDPLCSNPSLCDYTQEVGSCIYLQMVQWNDNNYNDSIDDGELATLDSEVQLPSVGQNSTLDIKLIAQNNYEQEIYWTVVQQPDNGGTLLLSSNQTTDSEVVLASLTTDYGDFGDTEFQIKINTDTGPDDYTHLTEGVEQIITFRTTITDAEFAPMWNNTSPQLITLNGVPTTIDVIQSVSNYDELIGGFLPIPKEDDGVVPPIIDFLQLNNESVTDPDEDPISINVQYFDDQDGDNNGNFENIGNEFTDGPGSWIKLYPDNCTRGENGWNIAGQPCTGIEFSNAEGSQYSSVQPLLIKVTAWDSTPGLPDNSSDAYFFIAPYSTTGPSGDISISPASSFGVSIDSFLINAVGDDTGIAPNGESTNPDNIGGWITENEFENYNRIRFYELQIFDEDENEIFNQIYSWIDNASYEPLTEIVQNGVLFKAESSGIYTILLTVEDNSSGNTSTAIQTELVVQNIIEINQTISDSFLSYQGINWIDFESDNRGNLIEETIQDDDKRPDLGCFYYSRNQIPDYDGTIDFWRTTIALNYENSQIEEQYGNVYESIVQTNDMNKFTPDVDVRSVESYDGFKSVLYNYYDEQLDEQKYIETSAPLEAAFYFYPRQTTDDIIDTRSVVQDFQINSLEYKYYVGFMDWGDGSTEFFDEPKQLGNDTLIKHSYEKSGIYEITGWMFKQLIDVETLIGVGVVSYKNFTIRINLNQDRDIESEFRRLGGEDFTFIPYNETTPVIGGISKQSIYYRTINRQLGYLSDNNTPSYEPPFKNYYDKFLTELALSHMDDEKIGENLETFSDEYLGNVNVFNECIGDDIVEIIPSSFIGCQQIFFPSCADFTEDESSCNYYSSAGCTYEYTCRGNQDYFEYGNWAPSYPPMVDSFGNQLFSSFQTFELYECLWHGVYWPSEWNDIIIPGPNDYSENPISLYDIAINFFDIDYPDFFENDLESCTAAEGCNTNQSCTGTINPDLIPDCTSQFTQESCDNLAHCQSQFSEPQEITTSCGDFTTEEECIEPCIKNYVLETGVTIYDGSEYLKQGELGDHLGDVDLAQVRYFKDGSFQMYEFLGMDEDGGTPDNPRYWKNIIPENYTIYEREGVGGINDFQLLLDIFTILSITLNDNKIDYDFFEQKLQEYGICTGACPDYIVAAYQSLGDNNAEINLSEQEKLIRFDINNDDGISVQDIIILVEEYIATPILEPYTIDPNSTQQWTGGYYYPVLPRLKANGEFMDGDNLQNNNIPFGNERNWDEDDELAAITNLQIIDEFSNNMLIDLDFSEIDEDSLGDSSGNNNLGILIGDYRIEFDSETLSPSKTSNVNEPKLEFNRGKAF